MNNLTSFMISMFLSTLVSAESKKYCYGRDGFYNFFYINGILNSKSDAFNSSFTFREIIDSKIVSIHNETGGFSRFYEDINEVLIQLDLDRKRTLVLDRKKEINKDSTSKIAIENLKSLSKDKKNFIFAHSQGNLFTNAMCDLKDDDIHMEVFSIATPTEYLKCNSLKTYVLFKNDSVINNISRIRKHTPLEAKYTDVESKGSLGFLHHTLESYLNNPSVVRDLKTGVENTLNLVYEKNYKFKMATLKIKKKNKLDELVDSAEEIKDSAGLWIREKKAFINSMSYASSLLNLNNLKSKNGLKKIMDTEIPASSEQEFADMIAFSLNSLSKVCSTHLGSSLAKVCRKIEIKDYFSKKEEFIPYLEADGKKDQSLNVVCKDVVGLHDSLIKKKVDVKLSFVHESPPLVYNEKSLDFKIYSEYSHFVSENVGSFVFSKDEQKMYHVDFVPILIESKESLTNNDQLSQCNTLKKLGSNKCMVFLKKLEKKYFSYYD